MVNQLNWDVREGVTVAMERNLGVELISVTFGVKGGEMIQNFQLQCPLLDVIP